MTYPRKLLTDKKQIQLWLAQHEIRNYSIHKDLSVSVYEAVCFSNKQLEYFPFNFFVAHEDFDCSGAELFTLEGSPEKVFGSFNCKKNCFTTLQGAPRYVEKEFNCSLNSIHSLEGSPLSVGGFAANFTGIKDLKGISPKIKDFISVNECQLISLEGLPPVLNGSLYAGYNRLSSFDTFPRKIKGTLSVEGNKITHCVNFPQVEGTINVSHNQLVSLKGLPKKVKCLNLAFNQLESLKGISQEISLGLYLNRNKLTVIDALPQKLGAALNLEVNPLSTLNQVKLPELLGEVKLFVNTGALQFLEPHLNTTGDHDAVWNLNHIKAIVETQEERKSLDKKLSSPHQNNSVNKIHKI